MPDDGVEVVEAEAAADDANVCVKGNDRVPAGVLAA